MALLVTGIFVIVCQVKINVTNAYAGSIAWSNFFSRVTHAHPGRVVWLVFNVLIAAFLVFLGDQLGVGSQLSTAVIVVLGIRIFSNAAAIRRLLFRS